MLFAFINCFTCTDKDITVAPTSRGALLLSFVRVIEAAIVCMLFVPAPAATDAAAASGSEGLDLSVGGGGFQVKHFLQAESFLAVFLQLGSFCCLLAAAAVEKMEHEQTLAAAAAHARRLLFPSAIARAGSHSDSRQCCCHAERGFLYVLLATVCGVLVFSLRILLHVYLVGDVPVAMAAAGAGQGESSEGGRGDAQGGVDSGGGGGGGGGGGASRTGHLESTFSCRTAVLLSLVGMCGVVLVCIRLAASYQLFWGTPQQHRSSTEQVALVALLVWFLATAWVLGLGGAQPILEGQEWTEAGTLDTSAISRLLDDLVAAVTSRC
jgi:hypothetical protein